MTFKAHGLFIHTQPLRFDQCLIEDMIRAVCVAMNWQEVAVSAAE